MRREQLVNDAVAAVLENLYQLAEEQGCVKTWQIEEAVRAGMEALLIFYIRDVTESSPN